MTRKPKAVIFDCDGVLVNSEPIANSVLKDNLARHGLKLTMAQLAEHYVGGTTEKVAETARAAGAKLPDYWIKEFRADLFHRFAKGVPLIEGVVAVLDRLDAAGIPYAVGSNGSDEKMAITLGPYSDLRARLHGLLFSAEAIGVPKPAPDLYLHAAAALGVAPRDCVVIDDSASGCTAGVSAGMRTLGFAAQDDGAKLAKVGAEVFHRMADLPDLLGI